MIEDNRRKIMLAFILVGGLIYIGITCAIVYAPLKTAEVPQQLVVADTTEEVIPIDSILAPIVDANDVPIPTIDTVASENYSKFNIYVHLGIIGGDSAATMIFTKKGIVCEKINSLGLHYPVQLDFNSDYLLTCSKKGYATKIVYFDTHIPKGRDEEEFAKFTVLIELHKTGTEPSRDLTKPVGGVKYIPEEGDFNVAASEKL